MNKFYFFKVTLNYFDDETKTFFITPDQSETDERGVPFSENDLRNTEDFKEFVKATKSYIIDVDYTEYAAEYDPKKHDITGKPVTSESFEELMQSGQLEIVDENQFLLLLREKKTSGGNKSKLVYSAAIFVAVFLIGIFTGAALKGGKSDNPSSGASEVSEVSENVSEETSEAPESSVESTVNELEEPPVSESVPNVSEAPESTAETSSVQSAVQPPQSSAASTASTSVSKPPETVSSSSSSAASSQSRPTESGGDTHEVEPDASSSQPQSTLPTPAASSRG